MDTQKTVLILGAGNFQIDAISLCKDRGWRVLGCSYRDMDPGVPMLDGFKQIDIKDIDGVAAFASDENVDIVYSVGSDLAMPTAMAVSEKLGLPHYLSSNTARACQNKGLMRETFANHPWSLPYCVAKTVEEALTFGKYPLMLKPVDSQGQRGCFRVNNKDDLTALFDESKQHSVEGAVILESYVDGPEISVNAFIKDGEVVFCLPSDRYSFEELPGGIIKAHALPCSVLDEQGLFNVRKMVEGVVSVLGIENGPLYFQVKMEGQTPRLIEVTPRLDGCHMWRFIKEYCGVDLLAASFDLLTSGILTQDMEPNPSDGDWRLTFMCEKPGCAFNRDLYDVKDAIVLKWYYQTGDKVRPLNGLMEKCGYKIHRVG